MKMVGAIKTFTLFLFLVLSGKLALTIAEVALARRCFQLGLEKSIVTNYSLSNGCYGIINNERSAPIEKIRYQNVVGGRGIWFIE